MIVPAVHPESWNKTVTCAIPGESWVALGVHPYAYNSLTDAQIATALDSLRTLIPQHRDKIVAIGEVGFDGALDRVLAPPERQERIVRWHAELALSLDLPLVLHVLRAHEQALRVLKSVPLRHVPGVIHSYSGGPELVKAYVDLGFYLSFAGSITRDRAIKPLRAVQQTPAERLLVETDAPDQRPTGAIGGLQPDRCEPSHLTGIIQAAARARQSSYEAIDELTTTNAKRLFRL